MLKKILKFSVILGVLFAIVIAVAVWRINPILEKLRPKIVKKVSETLGREVSIGEMQARFFPQAGIELNNVALSSGGSEGEARLAKVILYTEVTSLFRGQVDVSELRLEDGLFEITREKNGQISLAGIELVPSKQAAATSKTAVKTADMSSDASGQVTRTSEVDSPAGSGQNDTGKSSSGKSSSGKSSSGLAKEASGTSPEKSTALDFKIKDASIANIEVAWHDKMVSPAAKIRLSDLSAELSNIAVDSEGKVDITASLLGTTPKNISIQGVVKLPEGGGIPAAEVTTRLADLDLKRVKELAKSYGADVQKIGLDKSLDYEVKVTTSDEGIQLVSKLDAGRADISFDKAFTKTSDTPFLLEISAVPSLLGAVNADKVDVTIGGIKLSAPTSYDPRSGTSSHIRTQSFALKDLAALLPPLKAFDLSGSIDSDIRVKVDAQPKKGSLPKIEGNLVLKGISANVPMKSKDGANLQLPISDGSGTIAIKDETVIVKPFEIKVAGQSISLGATVSNLKAPDIRYALSAKNMALKPILTSVMPGGVPSLNGTTVGLLQLTGTHGTSSRNGSSTIRIEKSAVAGASLSKVDFKASYGLNTDGSLASLDASNGLIEAFGGRLTLSPQIRNSSSVKAELLGRSLDLAQLGKIALADSAVGVAGDLEKFTGKVSTDLKSPVPSLIATVNGTAKDGEITGFNVLKSVLEKLSLIPGLQGSLLNRIPEKYRIVVQGDSTKFKILNFQSSTANKVVTLKSFTLEHPAYIINGEGTVAFAGAMKLNTQLRLTPLLTEELVLKEPKIKLLMDRQGNIVIPVVITMVGGKPVVLPDVEQLVSRAATNTAKEAGKKALDKVAPGLGGALDSLF